MLPAIVVVLGGAITSVEPGLAALTEAAPFETPPHTMNVSAAPASAPRAELPNASCQSQDARSITVCAQRPQGYRLDPTVTEASREAEQRSRSATSAVPAAQAVCSTSPTGCPARLRSLDWANVAFVVATTAVRAAKGEDWTKAFKTGGSTDEYQLYQQAKQRREARDTERAAAVVKREAEEAERLAASKSSSR